MVLNLELHCSLAQLFHPMTSDDVSCSFVQMLQHRPKDGMAKAHLGFIIKAIDGKDEEAIPYLQDGIDSEEPGTQDGRFYMHLGDAYHRVGKPDQVSHSRDRAGDTVKSYIQTMCELKPGLYSV